MKISIIAAVDENRGIGKQGKMPWDIPEDLERFKQLTSGHPVIMGRKTFDSLGKPLTNRTNIIITQNSNTKIKKCFVANSLEESIKIAKEQPGSDEIFIIGGGQIYKQAIAVANKLYLTMVKGVFDVDTVFPDYSMFSKKTFEQPGESNGFEYTFINLEK